MSGWSAPPFRNLPSSLHEAGRPPRRPSSCSARWRGIIGHDVLGRPWPLGARLAKGAHRRRMVLDARKAPEHNREWGWADQVAAPKTPAAPATVSGEGLRSATGPQGSGRPETPSEPRARRPAVHVLRPRPSGVTARRI